MSALKPAENCRAAGEAFLQTAELWTLVCRGVEDLSSLPLPFPTRNMRGVEWTAKHPSTMQSKERPFYSLHTELELLGPSHAGICTQELPWKVETVEEDHSHMNALHISASVLNWFLWSFIFKNLPWGSEGSEAAACSHSHDGGQVAGTGDGLDAVAQKEFAGRPAPAVAQAAAGCQHTDTDEHSPGNQSEGLLVTEHGLTWMGAAEEGGEEEEGAQSRCQARFAVCHRASDVRASLWQSWRGSSARLGDGVCASTHGWNTKHLLSGNSQLGEGLKLGSIFRTNEELKIEMCLKKVTGKEAGLRFSALFTAVKCAVSLLVTQHWCS